MLAATSGITSGSLCSIQAYTTWLAVAPTSSATAFNAALSYLNRRRYEFDKGLRHIGKEVDMLSYSAYDKLLIPEKDAS